MILMYFFGYLMNLSDNIPYYLTKIGILKQSVPFLNDILSNRQHGNKKRVINRGKIEFKKISFRYPKSDSYLYHKLSLEIKAGEHVGVMGSSGSGNIVDTVLPLIDLRLKSSIRPSLATQTLALNLRSNVHLFLSITVSTWHLSITQLMLVKKTPARRPNLRV